jgi:hypothetical protein
MFYQNYLAMSYSADVTDGKPIAVWSQSISGLNAINPIIGFYDIHGRKREVILFYFCPGDHTRLTTHMISLDNITQRHKIPNQGKLWGSDNGYKDTLTNFFVNTYKKMSTQNMI